MEPCSIPPAQLRERNRKWVKLAGKQMQARRKREKKKERRKAKKEKNMTLGLWCRINGVFVGLNGLSAIHNIQVDVYLYVHKNLY